MRSRSISRLSFFSVLLAFVLLTGCAHQYRPGPGWVETGTASWYGEDFHGKPTAMGEPYDMYGVTAAHKTIPLGSTVRVTNLANGNQVIVPINDRGPFVGDRIIDMSYGAACKLDMVDAGLARVRVEVLEMPRYYSGGRYALQFGSFSARDNARRLAITIESRGYTPSIEEASVYGSTVYRVRLGAFTSMDNARNLMQSFTSQGLTCYIVGL
ncbi:MAG TPA: septal ring lytic transglycosylase RlpA family protein [Deltaproteobacteria bacterium]|nr:septal ring lytic transglycosylase RlpA family protein [Deltaproteobacteria bacterium]HXK47692.1 septal ring lytic transglycosylase RlpA family protein [Deltaproteobacteria bacterium]